MTVNNIKREKKGPKERIIFWTDHRGSHDGQQDFILKIGDEISDNVYGYIEYDLFQEEISIENIFVYPQHRRKGYATRLMDELKRQYPGVEIKKGLMLPEGEEFFKAYKRRNK